MKNFLHFFKKKKTKPVRDDEPDEGERFEPDEEDGIIMEDPEEPRVATFKKKWIYLVAILLSMLFVGMLMYGFFSNSRKHRQTEKIVQNNVAQGAHLKDVPDSYKEKQKGESRFKEDSTPTVVKPATVPNDPPPYSYRSYGAPPQPPRPPQLQKETPPMTAAEKERLWQYEESRKAKKSPIKFNLNLEKERKGK